VSLRLLIGNLRRKLHTEHDPVLGERHSDLQRIWDVDDDEHMPIRLHGYRDM
jgi:hypothetical protein